LDLKDIKELIALMRKNDLSVFKLEEQGFKITLKRGADPIITTVGAPLALPASALAAPSAGNSSANAAATPAAPAATASGEKLKEITSPMVGTFYGAPSPEAQPFLKPGQDISPDTVVCIIEAMKVMNEIKAECSGTVVEVVAENGKPVQYGQVLVRIRPK
jgi:acetyl-CoA carboxylase biotin carboxyl carrier protein